MNLAVLSALFAPVARGGAERVAELAARALVGQGCRVSVFTLDAPGARAGERVRDDGLLVYRVPCPNRYHPLEAGAHGIAARLAWHVRDLQTRATVAPLGAMLDAERVAAVVSHNLKGLGLRCLEAVRERGLPHVHVLHDLQLSVASGVQWVRPRLDAHPWIRRWHERAVQRRIGSPRAVVAPSHYVLREHLARGFFPRAQAVVLRNPVLPADPLAAAAAPAGPARFAFVGQIVEHKGISVLLRAWARQRPPGAELHVAGEGALAGELAAAAQRDPSLIVHGRLDAAAVRALLATTDAVVVPSIWHENSPLAVVEALAAGCAVVASRVGGIPELVPPDCGVLVAPLSADALAEGLAQVARDVTLWRGRRAAIAARQHGPTPDEYAQALLGLLGRTPVRAP